MFEVVVVIVGLVVFSVMAFIGQEVLWQEVVLSFGV